MIGCPHQLNYRSLPALSVCEDAQCIITTLVEYSYSRCSCYRFTLNTSFTSQQQRCVCVWVWESAPESWVFPSTAQASRNKVLICSYRSAVCHSEHQGEDKALDCVNCFSSFTQHTHKYTEIYILTFAPLHIKSQFNHMYFLIPLRADCLCCVSVCEISTSTPTQLKFIWISIWLVANLACKIVWVWVFWCMTTSTSKKRKYKQVL